MTTKAQTKEDRYIEAVGRRKTAVARVRMYPAAKFSVMVNDLQLEKYFTVPELVKDVQDPFLKLKGDAHFKISAHVVGGGIAAQAVAIRHGIARFFIQLRCQSA